MPKNLHIDDEAKLLTWDSVSGVTGYDIDIDGVEDFSATNSYSLDTDVFNKAKVYTIKVRSVIPHKQNEIYKYTSDWAEITYTLEVTQKLGAPTDIVFDEATRILSWGKVRYADRYALEVNVGAVRHTDWCVENFRSLPAELFTALDTLYIKVQAIYDDVSAYDSDWSGQYEYTLTSVVPRLAAPTNLRLEGKVLSWDAVDGAGPDEEGWAKYRIKITHDGIFSYSTTLSDTSRDLSEYLRTPYKWEIYVHAFGNQTTTADSLYSEALIHDMRITFDVPTNIRLDGRTVRWDYVKYPEGSYILGDVKSYIVECDGVAFPTAQNFFTLPHGIHTVRVKTIGNTTSFFDSEFSESADFDCRDTLTTVQNIRPEDGDLIWDKKGGAAGYIIDIDGTEYELEDESYSFANLATGESRNVKIMAKGNGVTTADSDWSAVYTVVRPAAVESINIDNDMYNYCVWWSRYDYAKNYAVSVNGREFICSNELIFNFQPTEYTVKVKINTQVGNSRYIIFESDWTEITFTVSRLDEIDGVEVDLDGETLSWDEVSGAVTYILVCEYSGWYDGAEQDDDVIEVPYDSYGENDISYLLSGLFNYYDFGTLRITIIALGEYDPDTQTLTLNSVGQPIEFAKSASSE